MTKQEFIEYLGERLTYEDIKKADAEAKAYVKGFIEGLDARPEPQGEWVEGETFYFCGEQQFPMTCSICGRSALNEPWSFCPNCGAKMVK